MKLTFWMVHKNTISLKEASFISGLCSVVIDLVAVENRKTATIANDDVTVSKAESYRSRMVSRSNVNGVLLYYLPTYPDMSEMALVRCLAIGTSCLSDLCRNQNDDHHDRLLEYKEPHSLCECLESAKIYRQAYTQGSMYSHDTLPNCLCLAIFGSSFLRPAIYDSIRAGRSFLTLKLGTHPILVLDMWLASRLQE